MSNNNKQKSPSISISNSKTKPKKCSTYLTQLTNQIKYQLQQHQIYIINDPRINNNNNNNNKRVVDRQQNQQKILQYKNILNAIFQIYKNQQYRQKYDLICNYVARIQQNMNNNMDNNKDEGIYNQNQYQGKIITGFANFIEIQDRIKNKQVITECKIVGFKPKTMSLSKFIQIIIKNNRKQHSLNHSKIHKIYKNNTYKYQQKFYEQKYPKKNRSKSKQINESLSSEQQFKQRQKKIKQKKQLNQEKKNTNKNKNQLNTSRSSTKRKLQIVSGSQDSNQIEINKKTQQMQKQRNNKLKNQEKDIEKQKQDIKQVRKQDKQKKKVVSRQKKQTKSKSKNKINSQLLAIQQAQKSEQISNKKNSQTKKQKSRKNKKSQESQKLNNNNNNNQKNTNPLSFMHKKMDITPIQNKQQELQSISQDLSNENICSQKSQKIRETAEKSSNSEQDNMQIQVKKVEEKINQIINTTKSQSSVINKIRKNDNSQRSQTEFKQIDQQNQKQILNSLCISSTSNKQLSINYNKQKNNVSFSAKVSPRQTSDQSNKINPVKSKKNKKQIIIANNMTLDQFFRKKEK